VCGASTTFTHRAYKAYFRGPFNSTLGCMKTIHCSACTLEPQIQSHAIETLDVLSDPAIYQYEGVPPPSMEKLADGYRRRESRVSPDGKEQWLNWVVRIPTGELTGYVQSTVLGNGSAFVGYEFSSKYWRRGIATAAMRCMLQELSETYQVDTYVAVLKAENFRSLGLLQKLGFTPGTPEDAKHYEADTDEITLLMQAKVFATISHLGDAA
jgi:[ribosomal protein S5]-alanine N-acetyltransferase